MSSNSGPRLTPGEVEVIILASRGLTDKQIASELNLSEGAVKSRWKRIRAKFQTSRRTEIILEFANLQLQDVQTRLAEESARCQELQDQVQTLKQLLEDQDAQHAETGVRLMDRFRELQENKKKLQAYERFENTLRDVRAILYQAESTKPYRCHFLSDSCDLVNIDEPLVTSRTKCVYDYVVKADMSKIFSSATEADDHRKTRNAFLYRFKGPKPRYFLSFTRNHGVEGDLPTDYSGIAIDVQDLVDAGLIDPKKGSFWRLSD